MVDGSMFKIQIVGKFADGSRPAAVFGDMCIFMTIGRPQQADWQHLLTASRLATLPHSMPIGYLRHVL